MDIVGTVSAAISFVDFIVKAVNVSKEVADSGQAVKEHGELDALANTVCQGYSNLQQKLDQKGLHGLTPEEASLLTVLKHCTEVHARIRKLRDKGEVQKPVKAEGSSMAGRVRDKFRYGGKVGAVAIRVIWNSKEDGGSLRAQFTACSVALNSALLLVMKKENLEIWETGFRCLRQSLDRAHDTQRQNNNGISGVIGKCDDISQSVSQWARNSKTYEDHLARLEDKFDEQSEIQESWQHQLQVLGALFTTMSETVRDLGYQRLLHDISFPDMNTRRREIQETHLADGSFEWLVGDITTPNPEFPSFEERAFETRPMIPTRRAHVDDDTLRRSHGWAFQTWLREDHGVFYISGKPGSGKSCVMDFLSGHPSTRAMLGQWEPCRPDLIIASAFFWGPGSHLQKSKEGLLRTLLYACLATRPQDLIPWLFPDRMTKHVRLFSSPFDGPAGVLPFRRVQESLERLVANPPPKLKLCLFIDGADEFQDPSSESFELAKLLMKWSSNSWVKICLSGREEEPWLGYFRNRPRLRLHEVTARDIRLMVEKSISGHDHFLSFTTLEQYSFIDEFVRKAEGVFIWVRYVKRDIVEALDYKQTLNHLYQILSDFPTELGPFYKKMFDRIKEDEAWIILKLMCTAIDHWRNPTLLSAHHYSFVGEVVRAGREKGTETPKEFEEEEQDEELVARLYGFESQVPRLFRGVVEVSDDGYLGNLTFTHKTTRDFLDDYIAGRLGVVSQARRPIMDSGVDEAKLVLQLITRQILAYWDSDSHHMLAATIATVVLWIQQLKDNRGCFEELCNLEKALMSTQGKRRTSRAPRLPFEDFGRWRADNDDQRNIRAHLFELGYTLPSRESLISVFALCVTFGFVEFVEWLRANPMACSTTFKTGDRQAALVDMLFLGFRGKRPKLGQMLKQLVRTPDPVHDGSTPGKSIVDPLSTLRNTSGLLGPRDLTVSEYVLLRMVESYGFFIGAIMPWKTLAVLLEYGAKMDVVFRLTVHDKTGKRTESGDTTDLPCGYLTVQASDQHTNGQRALGWRIKVAVSNRKVSPILEDEFAEGASLFELFDLVGPKNDPKISRIFETARRATQYRSPDTPGLPTNPMHGSLGVDSQTLGSQESEMGKGQEEEETSDREEETVTKPWAWQVYLLYTLPVVIGIVLGLIINEMMAPG